MKGSYSTLKIEGGLIGYDIIERIADGSELGQKAYDFGLDANTRLSDKIAADWSYIRELWRLFERRLENIPTDDPATSITRDQWVIPLLRCLGYEELIYQQRAANIDGLTFYISHRAGKEETAPPVHIVGARQSLDKRPDSGRPRLAPHALLQEYLNRSDQVWGLVTNGKTLRILRDSQKMRKQAYLEFDLEQMMRGEKFAEFVLLYRLTHRTRFPQNLAHAGECLLEKYHLLTIKQGGRVRDRLRDGVEEALKIFGNGFANNLHNVNLRKEISSGQLTPKDLYKQLLRLIYRILFLMVAEERNLITTNPIYLDHYSLNRLRRLLENRSAWTDHEDLWLGLRTTFEIFRNEKLGECLNIRSLNGDLFSSSEMAFIDNAVITNAEFLNGLWQLGMYREDEHSPAPNKLCAALDVEELGSVYESLLELHPVLLEINGQFNFDFEQGTERRSTGSYYTPPELVQELVKSALVPVMEDCLKDTKTTADEEKVLLSMKVLDPACGSGHFLLAAARCLGKRLAKVRTGEDEPTPEPLRLAIRDVITNCIYGVDKNPLAVDLCKVALWIEGHSKDKPLTFLDHRIRCGDSLVGVLTINVLRDGIPDGAFEPVESDDKVVARRLKNRNREERRGTPWLPFEPEKEISNLDNQFQRLYAIPDNNAYNVREKAEVYQRLRSDETPWYKEKVACDLWTSAFFVELTPENEREGRIPTHKVLMDYLDADLIDPETKKYSSELSEKYAFFHWPLEFPEVFKKGGFDILLGNPPFMGGLKISTLFGEKYHHYLKLNYKPLSGIADLCASFYRRAFSLLKEEGMMGMVATNTIGQGDTRESGLEVILKNGGVITSAHRFIKWPGEANVEVNLVSIRRGTWKKERMLDGKPVSFISSRLDEGPEEQARVLSQKVNKSFQGDIVRGVGFIIEPEEAYSLIAKDSKNKDCIFPYLNGDDINDHSDQKPSRFVICFHDWDLNRASGYPDLLKILEERVKPERDKVRQNKDREKWWLFSAYRKELRNAIESLSRVLVRSRVSELHAITFVPKGWVYSDATIVFAYDDYYHFALLQSSIHEVWLRRNASTMRTDIRYTPTDCFDTFPFPQDPGEDLIKETELKGEAYHEYRRQVMISRHAGLTRTYNLYNDPACTDEDIVQLRKLHLEVDRAVMACYGWRDISIVHDFYKNGRQQIRFTIPSETKSEIIKRLLALNRSLAAQ